MLPTIPNNSICPRQLMCPSLHDETLSTLLRLPSAVRTRGDAMEDEVASSAPHPHRRRRLPPSGQHARLCGSPAPPPPLPPLQPGGLYKVDSRLIVFERPRAAQCRCGSSARLRRSRGASLEDVNVLPHARALVLRDALGDPHDVPNLLLLDLHIGIVHAIVELLLEGEAVEVDLELKELVLQ